jgi:amino acid transporter
MKLQTKKILGVIIGAIVLLVVFLGASHVLNLTPQAFAQTTNGDAGGFVHCGNEAGSPCTVGDLFKAFVVIINYLIAMAGFIAVIAIVYAGFQMVYSQGQEQLKSAKSRFSGAVVGLVLVAGAFILVNSLFAGRFSIGVCDGESILTSPLSYIQNKACDKASTSSTTSTTTTNTTTTKPANTTVTPTSKTAPKVGK